MRKRNYVRSAGNSRDVRRKRLFGVVAAAAGVYLLATFIFGEMGLVKYYRMKTQNDDLQREIDKIKQENVQLLKDVRSLRSDPALIERIARDKLGLARPGEIVYYYRDADSESDAHNPR